MFFAPSGAVSPYLSNLVAYWKFDSNSNDFSGNGHNGTDTNISYSNAGKVSNSATFNGTSSNILVSQSTDFDFSNATNDLPFSISMGIYLSGTTDYFFLSKYNNTTNFQWEIQQSGSRLYIILFSNGSTYIGTYTTATLPTGVWLHFGFTYDGSATTGGLKTYINGVLQTVTSFTAGTYTKMPITNTPVGIGCASNGTSFRLNGRTDECYVWKNRILTGAEILTASNEFYAGNPLI